MSDDQTPQHETEHAALLASLGKLARAANASIRGYLTQVVYSALAWLELSEDEILVVEGREDLDKFILDENGRVREVTEVQLKDLAEAVNAREEAVWESIFNFLLSFERHHAEGRSCRMIFATTAGLKSQTTASTTGVRETEKTTRLDLEVDVISTWISLGGLEGDSRTKSVEQLSRAIRGLFDACLRPLLPSSDAQKEKAEVRRAQDVLTAIDRHDTNGTWGAFFGAVTWLTELLESASELATSLQAKVAEHDALNQLPDLEFAQILIYRVLAAASQSEVTDRFLTLEDLRSLASESAASLREWAEKVGLVHLGEWQRQIEDKVAEHGERLDELEGAIATTLPTTQRAWESIATFTRAGRRRVRVEIDGVHVARDEQLESLDEKLRSERTVVLLGGSGAGKSALVREYTERFDSSGGLTLWLGGASLERPDLAALCTDLDLGIPLEVVFEAHTDPTMLVLDGLDRVYEDSALALLANLLNVLRIGTANALCGVVITCQTQGWPSLEGLLHRERIDTSAWAFHECVPPRLSDLKPIWDVVPAARRIAYEPRLSALMQNLKILDLVVTRIVSGDSPDPGRFVGESSIASWFWGNAVVSGPSQRTRDLLTMRLGERQADRLRLSISLDDLGVAGAAALDTLEADRICVVDERNHVLFAHDLYGDWARLRALQFQGDDLVAYLRERLDSPLWHRAIRLLGAQLLDERDDLVGWKALLRSLHDTGGDSASDLLLESVVFTANSLKHLELLADELLAAESGLLDRLLGRFLAFATLPDPQMREIGRSVGMSDAKVAALYRYPNWPYWPAVLQFLHSHRDKVTKVAPLRVARVARLWLEHTSPGTGYRREAGEIGLLLGRLAIDGRWSFPAGREELLAVSLAGVPECEDEIVAFALEASERATEQKADTRNLSILKQMFPDLDPEEPMPTPAPDGPKNRVDENFRTIILTGTALTPLMRRRPDVAREIILACLLASRHIGDRYQHHLDEWDFDLAFTHGSWSPPSPFRGPFGSLLRENFSEGLETIARFVDFMIERWCERRHQRGGRGQRLHDDTDSPPGLLIDLEGFPKTFLGDWRVLGWAAGLGQPLPNDVLTSALMALEQHLYVAMDANEDIEPLLRAILSRVQSVPFLHVLLDVGRKKPSLFLGPLRPLLGIPELYSWEITLQGQSRLHLTLCSPFEGVLVRRAIQEFNAHKHRKYDLRRIAVHLFLSDENVQAFLESKADEWTEKMGDLPPSQRKESFEQLVLMFNKDNYRVVDVGDGRSEFVNVALQGWEESTQEKRTALDAKITLNMLPLHCRRLIDEGQSIPEEALEGFVEELMRVETAWRTPEDNSSEVTTDEDEGTFAELERAHCAEAPANALAGGIAVLLCRHNDWVAAQTGLLQWCRATLIDLVLNPPARHAMDVPESVSTWSWDCFAAEAAVVLWEQSPEDQDLRRLVATLVLSPHNAAVALLLHRCGLMTSLRFEDVQGLRRLVFEFAYVRNRIEFVRQLTQNPGEVTEDEFQNLRGALDDWYQKCIENFASARVEPPTDDWEEMDNTGLFSHRDDLRQRRFAGYLIDFKLVRAAHQTSCTLEDARSSEERDYRLWFLKTALRFWIARLGEDGRESIRYPGEDERWVLYQLAAAVSHMSTEEHPDEIWQELLNLSSDQHHWSEIFLDTFFRTNLASDVPSESFPVLAKMFIEKALSLPVDLRWASGEEVWQSLFGIHGYIRDLWQRRHSDLAEAFWPSMRQWLSRERVPPQHVTAISLWLKTDAASSLRLEGLGILRDAIVDRDTWWSEHDRKSAEDAVADVLQTVWAHDSSAIRSFDDACGAFRALLRWLGEHQNSYGLELIGRIGNL